MRILKIIHGYPPAFNAGSEVYSRSICEKLAQQHEVHVFSRMDNPFLADHVLQTRQMDAVEVTFINKAREKDGYQHDATDGALADLVARFRPDVAHIGHLNHLSMGIPERLRSLGVPIVFTLHDFWLMCPRGQFLQINFGESAFNQLCEGQENSKCARHCYNRFFGGNAENRAADANYWTNWIGQRMAAARKVVEFTNHFIAPSEQLRRRFIRDFDVPSNKITYLDYGFPLENLPPIEPPVAAEPFVFGYIGTHIPAKGIDLLIDAFSRLPDSSKLKIWGRPIGTTTEALRQMAAPMGDRVVFMDEYENRNIADAVFKHINCVVVPSIWVENSPLVIHEAQACRVPVITADVGGMAEFVADSINGLLFKHRNAADLAEKMAFAVNNPLEMQRMGQRGYLFDEKGNPPSLAAHCDDLVTIYQKTITDSKT
jgi:glycosyltransferase involved in cell wall biosynthesis